MNKKELEDFSTLRLAFRLSGFVLYLRNENLKYPYKETLPKWEQRHGLLMGIWTLIKELFK